MKKIIILTGFILYVLLMTISCTSVHQSMKEPMSSVLFTKSDFLLSDQVTAEATSVTIFGIDWARLFSKKTGNIDDQSASINAANIPVIGSLVSDRTKNYALYNLMSQNSGYDVVFYPQYRTQVSKPFLGLGFIFKITVVNATARLGKLRDDADSPRERRSPIVQLEEKIRPVAQLEDKPRPVVQLEDETRPVVQLEDITNYEQNRSATSNQTNVYENNNSYSTGISEMKTRKTMETEVNIEADNEYYKASTPIGGEKAFIDYIERNRRQLSVYDDCSVVHGSVILMFKVNRRGRPEDIRVFRSLCRSADREAIRLLQNGPDWTENSSTTRLEINF